MKKLIAAAALLMLTVPAIAGAVELKGMWGVGYFQPSYPLGARIWVAPNWGIDAGLGFLNQGGDAPELTQFGIEIGAPIVFANTESAIFFFRPGFEWADLDNDASQWALNFDLGVEYWFTPNFTVQAAHGISYTSVTQDFGPPVGEQTGTQLATDAFGLTSIGFHWYFLKK
jgi:hypothetical protein